MAQIKIEKVRNIGISAHIDAGNGWAQWPLPSPDGINPVGNGQLILENGVAQPDTTAYAVRSVDGKTLSFNPHLTNATAEYDVIYGTRSATTHTASISFSESQHTTSSFDHYNYDPNDSTKVVSTTYNLTWVNDSNGMTTTVMGGLSGLFPSP